MTLVFKEDTDDRSTGMCVQQLRNYPPQSPRNNYQPNDCWSNEKIMLLHNRKAFSNVRCERVRFTGFQEGS